MTTEAGQDKTERAAMAPPAGTDAGQAPAPSDADNDVSAYWDEFEAADRKATEEDGSRDESIEESADEAGSDIEEAAGEDKVAEQKATDDKTKSTKSAEPEQKAKDSADGQAEEDWSDVSETHRAAYEAARQESERLKRSIDGYKRNLRGLQRQIDELRSRPAKPNGAAATDGDDDDIKEVVAEYPDVAKPLLKKIERLEQKLSHLDQRATSEVERRESEELDKEMETFETKHPDWENVLKDEQGRVRPDFVDWLNTQPRHIREAAARNGDKIVDAEEAADVIGRFKDFRSQQAGGNPSEAGPSGSQSGQSAGQQSRKETGNGLSGKRQRQLDAASATRSSGPGVADGIPEDGDPQALWEAWERHDQRHAAH